jgi:hypothetical protein
MEMAEWIFDFFNNASFESPVNEASKEEETKFHKKLDKLVHSTFGKRKGELKEDNLGHAEIKNIEKNLSPAQKEELAKLIKSGKIKTSKDLKNWQLSKKESVISSNIKEGIGNEVGDKVYFRNDLGEKYPSSQGYYGIIEDTTPARNYNMMAMYQVVVYDKNDNEIKTIQTDWTNLTSKMMNEEELTEANVPSNIKEFAKRKGVSSLVNKIAGWAEKVGAGIRGGTAIGKDYSTLILDMTYQGSEIRINTDNDTVTLYDEPVNSFNQFQRVYLENKEENNGLEERIHEALNKINEELCPAGKAYIKKRKAAGEKSSAYLSGRAVKVCKGQMSGKAKKK